MLSFSNSPIIIAWVSFQVRDAEAVNKRMKTDIHNCVGFIQEPKKLKESIKTVYETYVHDDVVGFVQGDLC